MNKSALFAAVLTAFATGVAPASGDTAPLEIVKVGYNATGPDTLSNRWQEYIDIRNVSGAAVNVKGWSVQDQWAHTKYGAHPEPGHCNTAVFSAGEGAGHFQHLSADNPDTAEVETEGLWLPKGHTIRVYTGGSVDGTPNSWHTIALNKSSCGYRGHYLNNTGDSIYLKNADGVLVTSFSYDFGDGYYVR